MRLYVLPSAPVDVPPFADLDLDLLDLPSGLFDGSTKAVDARDHATTETVDASTLRPASASAAVVNSSTFDSLLAALEAMSMMWSQETEDSRTKGP